MITTRVVHTAQLDASELGQVRRLLDVAFLGQFDDDDWDHCLGGLHVVSTGDGQVIAHAAVVRRQLVLDGRAIRTGYVEGVAVHPRCRGLGLAASTMDDVERIIRGGYDLGALSAADGVSGFYLARGWLAWQGATCVMAPNGVTRTPDDDDSTYVLPVAVAPPLLVTGTLCCDWRCGDVW